MYIFIYFLNLYIYNFIYIYIFLFSYPSSTPSVYFLQRIHKPEWHIVTKN